MPAVSILLPTFSRNASGLLSAAIESVLQQTFTDFELIVVDDASTDGSADTIAAFAARDPRVRTIRFSANVGLPALTTARAFCESRGERIAWMFDDCVWTPECLAALSCTLDASPGAALAYGQCVLKLTSGDIVIGDPLDRARLARGDNHIPNCATLVRREAYERFGWPDPSVLLVRFSDWDFWNRAAQFSDFAFIQKVIAEEHGATLADSLGNTITLKPGLMLRYAAIDRATALHPTRWQEWRPLAPPPGFLQTVADQEDYFELCLDHLIKVRHLESVHQLCQDPELKHVSANAASLPAALAWWANRIRGYAGAERARADALQSLVREKQAYIDQQQAYIDAMHANR